MAPETAGLPTVELPLIDQLRRADIRVEKRYHADMVTSREIAYRMIDLELFALIVEAVNLHTDLQKAALSDVTALEHRIAELQAQVVGLRSLHDEEAYDDMKAAKEQAEAELTEARQRQTWQPIETAPQDGTRVLVVGEGDRWRLGPVVARTLDKEHGWYSLPGKYYVQPSHWIPMPLLASLNGVGTPRQEQEKRSGEDLQNK